MDKNPSSPSGDIPADGAHLKGSPDGAHSKDSPTETAKDAVTPVGEKIGRAHV